MAIHFIDRSFWEAQDLSTTASALAPPDGDPVVLAVTIHFGEDGRILKTSVKRIEPVHSGGLVLSLFPGIGMLDHAFELEGFCVVRGPDLLWGGDIKRFHPPSGVFDGVIGGPPCQAFSRMRHINPRAGEKHGNVIPEFERCVSEAQPTWFLMENVKDAPVPSVDGYEVQPRLLADQSVGGVTDRIRRFSFGTRDGRNLPVETLALHPAESVPSVTSATRDAPVRLQRDGHGGHTTKKRARGENKKLSTSEMMDRQGFPPDWLDECPLTASGKRKVIGNGVPLAMGLAVAKAVKRASGGETTR